MISGGEMEFHVQGFSERSEKEGHNSVPLLEVTCNGTPCLEKTWSMNSFASIRVERVLIVGMNMDCLEKRSTMTRMVSNLEEVGNISMKSIEMEFPG
jgi:hypothetical protein